MVAKNEKALKLDQSKMLSLYGAEIVCDKAQDSDVKTLSVKVGKCQPLSPVTQAASGKNPPAKARKTS